ARARDRPAPRNRRQPGRHSAAVLARGGGGVRGGRHHRRAARLRHLAAGGERVLAQGRLRVDRGGDVVRAVGGGGLVVRAVARGSCVEGQPGGGVATWVGQMSWRWSSAPRAAWAGKASLPR